ncbi:MAG: ferrous iron transport protein B [Gemmatimonadaceae bacterium]|nr:ferrous iron transport protein B [Gemmatimonadaceae bacterium]
MTGPVVTASASHDTTGAAPLVAPPVRARVALIGNPNTGKSTLFNALTGMRVRVGNFPGVTVERVEGTLKGAGGATITILDLPGCYSLSPASPDEEIALAALHGTHDAARPDAVLVVADATQLERNLFLVSQVLELGLPVLVALNQVDAAADLGITVDAVELIHALGVPVIPTVATRGEGLDVLRKALLRATTHEVPTRRFALRPEVAEALAPLERHLVATQRVAPAVAVLDALRLLAVPAPESWYPQPRELAPELDEARIRVASTGANPRSIEAELRYAWIGTVVARAVVRRDGMRRTTSDRIDAVALHRLWGPVLFLAIMALLFQSIFSWAAPMQDALEAGVGAIGDVVGSLLPPGDLRDLLVRGVIGGVGSVVVFLPQICILFLAIGFLEDSGYMARAAFLMDRLMRRVGLHGRSFIPMLSGYACAVPAIMATRTIEESRDRLATMMVVPLMSCSARLPIYTLLIGAFVPSVPIVGGVVDLQGVTMLGMYLLGTVTALAVAAIFRRTLLRGPVRPMILELPPYRLPHWRTLAATVWSRAGLFLRRAGTVILACSIVLWALATYPRTAPAPGMSEAQAQELQLERSALGRVGHAMEPLVAPLGYDWKIGVSIAASFAAREVFVSTMGTIYGVGEADETSEALRDRLRGEVDADTGRPRYTTLVAVGLMVFYVYALMCMSTIAVTVREAGGGRVGWRWAAIQFGYMLGLAWGMAFLVYQGGRLLGFGG